MPARKKTSQPAKGSSQRAKKATKARSAFGVKVGPVPPYGVPIRQAIARGNPREMKALANATRKWLVDVESALEQLESSIRKNRT